jgi:hypothetical protein
MKTIETRTKKYKINKDLIVTVKSDPVEQDGQVETWKNTVTVKHTVEKLDPLKFKDVAAIREYLDNLDMQDSQLPLIPLDDDNE